MQLFYNGLQAQIAKKLVGTHGIHPDRIAAITPYSAQREEIRKQLQTQSLSAVLVKTITESQGITTGVFSQYSFV